MSDDDNGYQELFKLLVHGRSQMTRLWLRLECEGRWHVTREPDPTDSWDAGESAFTYSHTTAKILEVTGNNWDGEEVPEPGEEVYVVVHRYNDGGTFGHNYNYHEAVAWVRTAKEAENTRKELEAQESSGYFYEHVDYFIERVIVQDGREEF